MAQSYFSSAGASYVSGQEANTVEVINYANTMMQRIVQNLTVTTNYQNLNLQNLYSEEKPGQEDSELEQCTAEEHSPSLTNLMSRYGDRSELTSRSRTRWTSPLSEAPRAAGASADDERRRRRGPHRVVIV